MKRIILLLLISFTIQASAQKASLKGTVSDTANYKYMGYSGVSLILSKDSTLIRHVFTNDKGGFEINAIEPDTFQLLITHPGFVDYEDNLILKPGENKDLGDINLIFKATLLRELIVRDKRDAIRIKGDTTEFLVDSFLNNKNSNVEDLLKRLPGIQVDKNGKITAQGQEVKKVLVDGEEFFGNDPTVATRNLKAENVETVQVFDRKSEETQQTGIDDGTKEKTINLTLKDDAKKGYFGKASAGLGTEDRYEHDAMFNSFKKKRKFSVYGASSNTNKTSLNWEDADMYAGGMGETEVDESSGSVYSYYSNQDEDFSGVGIPQTWFSGLHYSNKSPSEKQSININGSHKELRVNGFDNNYTQSILPDTVYFNNQRKNFNSFKEATTGKAIYEWKLDSLSTLKIKANGTSGLSTSDNLFYSENLNENSLKVNDNERKQTDNSFKNQFSSSIAYNRKFKLKGRSLSFQLNQNYDGRNSNGFLTSTTNYFKGDGTLNNTDLIDQKNKSETQTTTWEGKAFYTEPLSKTWFVVSNYTLRNTRNTSYRFSFIKNTLNNEYSNLVDSLSNSLKYDITVNSGGLSLRYLTKKINLSFGAKASYTDLYQNNLVNNTTQEQHFLNIFPSVSFNYKIKTTSGFFVSYSGYTQQPTLQQIQPLRDNSNPLQIMIGNPNLKQSFSNSFNLRYNSFKPITGRSIYVSMFGSSTQNDFSYADNIDTSGRRTNQTINVNGNYDLSLYSNYYIKIKKTNFRIGNSLRGSRNRNTNTINARENINNFGNLGYGLNIDYNIEEKFEFEVGGNWDYNFSRSSLRSDITTQYWIQTYNVSTFVALPKKFFLDASCEFNIRQRTTDFDRNLNTTILNVSLSKKFLKKENLELTASVNDLLNQNLGFQRTASSNFINENTHTVLKRFFLFSLKWNFTHNAAQKKN